MARFADQMQALGIGALHIPGTLLPPAAFKLHQARYLMYEEVLTNEDGDDAELGLLLTLLPVIEAFRGVLEAFQRECGGELLLAAERLTTKLQVGIFEARRRYNITDTEIQDWHNYFNDLNAQEPG